MSRSCFLCDSPAPVTVQCVQCLRDGMDCYSYFCSTGCFRSHWEQHRVFGTSTGSDSSNSHPSSPPAFRSHSPDSPAAEGSSLGSYFDGVWTPSDVRAHHRLHHSGSLRGAAQHQSSGHCRPNEGWSNHQQHSHRAGRHGQGQNQHHQQRLASARS
mmetsp:Transcript_6490/g.11709  ORF Transcript_6490/g.11709 Transcript_6490/m.11709 type:complete len:156 (-) Transcript_6490:299-766(-)